MDKNKTKGIIEIEQMQFTAYHGHFPAEQIVGNQFEVYLYMECDCDAAGASDMLDDALNYQRAYELVKEQMLIPSKLLEHVCTRTLDTLYANFQNLDFAKVKISKLNPPMGGQIGRVSVKMSR